MDIFQSIILAIIEGFTEFLPVSSTGHMIVVGDWIGVRQTEINKAFELIIQLAAILAVITNYKERFSFKYTSLWLKIFISFLPLMVIGYIFKDEVKEMFSVEIVAIMFIVGGVIFLVLERLYDEKKSYIQTLDDVTLKQSIWIGVAQIFALIPGTSRAGATIVGAMFVGLSRKASTEYSFLLALPVMGAVSGYDLLKHYDDFAQTSFVPLIVGFVVTYFVALITMKLFIGFLSRFTFVAFGWYRIAFGALLLLVA